MEFFGVIPSSRLTPADGVYDPGGASPYVGRAAVGDLVCGERHRAYLKDGPHWRLERVSANRWELERIDGTWQVIRRTNRLLDGTPEARRLLTPPGR